MNIEKCLVRCEDGSLDMSQTLTNVQEALEAYEAKNASDLDTVKAAILNVFAKYPGVSINTAALTSAVMGDLALDFTQHSVIAARVKDCIHQNPDLFAMRKGPGGGVKLAEKPAAAA